MTQPVEKVLVEFVEEHMSLVDHQFPLRGETSRENIFGQKERAEIDKGRNVPCNER